MQNLENALKNKALSSINHISLVLNFSENNHVFLLRLQTIGRKTNAAMKGIEHSTNNIILRTIKLGWAGLHFAVTL